MRIVWVSRHELNQKNHEILRKAFGKYEIVQYKETVTDVRVLKAFADLNKADAYVVVLPPHIIMQLMRIDKRPVYRFIVERNLLKDEVVVTPVGLERIVKIEITAERIV